MKKLSPLFLILILIISVLFSLFFKVDDIQLFQVLIINLRLPRTLLCIITGSVLALCGSTFQMFFRNSLAEPGIMGITSGATLGAVITAISGITGTYLLSVLNAGAFLGALLSGIIISTLSLKKESISSIYLLLFGTALGTLYSALTSILLSANSSKIQSMYYWMLGSFSGRGWNELYFILLPALLSVILQLSCISRLDLMTCGENTADSLGINVNRLRVIVLIAGSLGTSAAVCAGGTIGFVGLIAPHITRRLFSPKARILLPLSMLVGSILVLISDTIARYAIYPAELPVGTITAIMGVPFFISLLSRGKK